MNSIEIETFLGKLKSDPESIAFDELIALIDTHYAFTPAEFKNGDLVNAAGENSGSCKLFSFAKLQGLDQAQTLACFGAYYRDDVLKHPEAENHQNIRNFMQTGWSGIHFETEALLKEPLEK